MSRGPCGSDRGHTMEVQDSFPTMTHARADTDPWTPERRRLREWLDENAPKLAAPYEAAVRLLHEPAFPARWHLLSHLVREIANGLPEVVTGRRFERFDTTKALDHLAEAWEKGYRDDSSYAEPETALASSVPIPAPLVRQVAQLVTDHQRPRRTKRDKTAQLIDALRPGSLELRPALEPILDAWAKTVDWFFKPVHVRRDDAREEQDEAELQRRFRHFEDGLRGITAGHFSVVREIDAILVSGAASEATLRRLLPFLSGAEQLRYFFRHPRLQAPEWLPVLEGAGFFKSSPEPIVDEQRRIETHVRWPASEYLVQMAAHGGAHDLVSRIARAVVSANTFVRDDILEIAQRLPPDSVAGLVETLVSNLRKAGWFGVRAERLAGLTATLAASGHQPEARRLFGVLVEVLDDPRQKASESAAFVPDARMHVHPLELERAFIEHLPRIVDGLGIAGLEALSGALAEAVRRSLGPSDGGHEDYSYIWRAEIEAGDCDDARGVLAGALFQAAVQLVERDGSSLELVLQSLEARQWQIFKRISLHLLGRRSPLPTQLVAARLLDRTLFDCFSTCREYRLLSELGFGCLDERQKAAWLEWVEQGASANRIREWLQFLGFPATDEDVARGQRQWQWRRLGLVRGSLPAAWLHRWESLEQEFGPPQPASTPEPEISETWIGTRSPLQEDQARALSVAELATFLRAWKPPSDQPFLSPEGLRAVVSDVVARAPHRYAAEASEFEGLPPTYMRGVLGGFARAVGDGRVFDWGRVLALAEWILRQPVVEPEPEGDPHGEDPGWGWTRGAIIELLGAALEKDPSPLPLSVEPVVLSLIETVCRDPSPQRRADALVAVVHCAAWVRVRRGQPWYGEGTLDDLVRVRAILDEALASSQPSPRVHEAFGRQLARLVYMDEMWVRANLSKIFPVDSDDALGQAAWRAYLAAARVYSRVFDVLTPVYRQAVDSLDPSGRSADQRDDAGDRLAEHLVVLLGRGTLEARGAASILEAFFSRASVSLRQHFLWYVGRSLQEHGTQVPADVLRRFQDFWDARVVLAETDARVLEELEAFGMWFGCGLFDRDWALQQLERVLTVSSGRVGYDHMVVERLAGLALERPAQVARCFGLLVGGLRDAGPVHGWLESSQVILSAALRSGVEEARAEAIDAFHKLGGLGFRAGQLVAFSSDLGDPAAIPYFTWDDPITVAEIRARLAEASEPERDRLLGQILREAKDSDVWAFTTPHEVAQRWSRIEPHLGKRRSFWQLLLGQWKEQGLLAR